MANRTILVVDDHTLFRSGIAAMLSTTFDDVVIVDVSSLGEAMADVESTPTIVLLDIQLPGLSGLEGMGLIQQRWPCARIVVVSAHDLPDTVAAALDRGAAAFLSKTDRPERMIAVLRPMLKASPVALSSSDEACQPVRQRLTARQTQVLELVGQALSNKTIGRRLGLSEHTVRGHVQALLGALGVTSRMEATLKARQLGLIR